MKSDVYKFRYSDEYLKNYKGIGDLYHCFDGILIEKENSEGIVYWEDTYWSGSENRWFGSMEDILSKGTIEFICNLDDVDDINEHEVKYYNEIDVVYLGMHKGYRSKYLIKKGVQKSKDVVLFGLKNKIKEIESNVEYELRKIEWLKKDIQDVESGEKELKNVYF